MNSVLLIDGGSYCATVAKVEQSLNFGEYVDHRKVITELEQIFSVQFGKKWFFQGTESRMPNKFHAYLSQALPNGPQFELEILGKKVQSGQSFSNRNENVSMWVEEGVDVAIAVKIVECAYGIGNEQQYDQIVLISGDCDLLRAVECVEKRNKNLIHVVADKSSLASSLRRFVFSDKVMGCAVYLDEVMFRCIGSREESAGVDDLCASVATLNLKNTARTNAELHAHTVDAANWSSGFGTKSSDSAATTAAVNSDKFNSEHEAKLERERLLQFRQDIQNKQQQRDIPDGVSVGKGTKDSCSNSTKKFTAFSLPKQKSSRPMFKKEQRKVDEAAETCIDNTNSITNNSSSNRSSSGGDGSNTKMSENEATKVLRSGLQKDSKC